MARINRIEKGDRIAIQFPEGSRPMTGTVLSVRAPNGQWLIRLMTDEGANLVWSEKDDGGTVKVIS